MTVKFTELLHPIALLFMWAQRRCPDMHITDRNGGKCKHGQAQHKGTASSISGACWFSDVVQTRIPRSVTETNSSMGKLSTKEHLQAFRVHVGQRRCPDMHIAESNGGKCKHAQAQHKGTAPSIPGACWLSDVVQTCRQRTVTEASSSTAKLSTKEQYQAFRLHVGSKTLPRHADNGP